MADDLTTLIAISRPLGPDQLVVEWNPMAPSIAPEAGAYIEARWSAYAAEARAAGKTLFNGPITRLIRARTETHKSEPEIVLTLGPADYKTFLVTCLRDRAWFEAHAPAAIAPALGNSALLTHGDRALLGIRSEKVSAYAGRAHLFGGVAELLGTEKFEASAAGLVAHLELELEEEAGLGSGELSGEGPRVMGLAYDRFLGQPELFWQWETEVELEQIVEKLDASEHSGTLIVDRRRVGAAALERMTPVARRTIGIWAGEP